MSYFYSYLFGVLCVYLVFCEVDGRYFSLMLLILLYFRQQKHPIIPYMSYGNKYRLDASNYLYIVFHARKKNKRKTAFLRMSWNS